MQAESIWAQLDFGKHDRRSLPQVLFADPDWFFWAFENGLFRRDWSLAAQAATVHQRATSIRIPARYGVGAAVGYATEESGRFGGMSLVSARYAADGGSSGSMLGSAIDMSFPRRLREYDKSGMRIMIRDLKEILFNDPDIRLTKRRVEAFFENDDNFVLRAPPASVGVSEPKCAPLVLGSLTPTEVADRMMRTIEEGIPVPGPLPTTYAGHSGGVGPFD